MGYPMAANLHRAGLLVAVWNRNTRIAERFAADTGCEASGSLSALASRCDAVVVCVSADDDVLQVVDTLCAGLEKGDLVVDCSTISATTSRLAARRLAEAGCEYLDCPVSGGTEGARDGELSIMVGGSEEGFARALPLLECLGGRVAHMGEVGAGQATKATNQIMVAGINQAVSEAMAFARAEGLPLERVVDALGHGAAASWFLTNRGPNMIAGSYPLGFKVALHEKDLRICQDMAARHGVKLPLVEMTLLHYGRLPEQDRENEDISSLYRIKSTLFAGAEGEEQQDR